MNITKRDPLTGKLNTKDIDITYDQLKAWDYGKGDLIQNVMPNLTPDEREFIMTGILPDSWTNVFGKDE